MVGLVYLNIFLNKFESDFVDFSGITYKEFICAILQRSESSRGKQRERQREREREVKTILNKIKFIGKRASRPALDHFFDAKKRFMKCSLELQEFGNGKFLI